MHYQEFTCPSTMIVALNGNSGSAYQPVRKAISHLLTHSRLFDVRVRETHSISELERFLQNNKCPEVLGVGGGDGSICHCLTMALKIWGEVPPYLAVFATGSMNELASAYDLSAGVIDKARGRLPRTLRDADLTQLLKTTPIKLAEYLAAGNFDVTGMPVQEVPIISVNDHLGFNVGIGSIPKLLWSGYGKTIEQYERLMQSCTNFPEVQRQVLERILSEPTLIHEIAEPQLSSLSKGAQGLYGLMVGLLGLIDKKRKLFYEEHLAARIIIDGKEIDSDDVNTICLSSYPRFSLGSPGLNFAPFPEADAIPEKVLAVFGRSSLFKTVQQLPRLYFGRKMLGYDYHHVTEVAMDSEQPLLAQVDGEFLLSNKFVMKYHGAVKLITPFAHAP